MRPVVYSNLMSGVWVASCGYVNYEQGWVGRAPLYFARGPPLDSARGPPLGFAQGPRLVSVVEPPLDFSRGPGPSNDNMASAVATAEARLLAEHAVPERSRGKKRGALRAPYNPTILIYENGGRTAVREWKVWTHSSASLPFHHFTIRERCASPPLTLHSHHTHSCSKHPWRPMR